jgi:hypothetical protein
MVDLIYPYPYVMFCHALDGYCMTCDVLWCLVLLCPFMSGYWLGWGRLCLVLGRLRPWWGWGVRGWLVLPACLCLPYCPRCPGWPEVPVSPDLGCAWLSGCLCCLVPGWPRCAWLALGHGLVTMVTLGGPIRVGVACCFGASVGCFPW